MSTTLLHIIFEAYYIPIVLTAVEGDIVCAVFLNFLFFFQQSTAQRHSFIFWADCLETW